MYDFSHIQWPLLEYTTCLFMTGLIWTIQLVHYPSFLWIDHKSFKDFNQFHQHKISLIVIPVMLFEVVACFMTILSSFTTLHIISCAFLAIAWANTMISMVPRHKKLLEGFDKPTITALIQLNWLRTLSWSIRSLILFDLLG